MVLISTTGCSSPHGFVKNFSYLSASVIDKQREIVDFRCWVVKVLYGDNIRVTESYHMLQHFY